MIFAIVIAILAYRRANDHGRSGIAWALAGISVFIGTQMLVTLGSGVLVGLGIGILGLQEDRYDSPAIVWPITIVAIGASVFTSWLLLRYLDRLGNQDPIDTPPPPPPTFDRGEQS